MIQRHTNLPAHVVSFCQYLRQHNFKVGTDEQTDALSIIGSYQAFTTPVQFKKCLQSIMCKSYRDMTQFSKHFDNYWKELSNAVDGKRKDKPERKNQIKQKKAASISQLKNWLYRADTTNTFETAMYSAEGVLGQKQFMNVDEEELHDILKIVEQIVNRIAKRRTRRFVTTRHRHKIDIRKSIRRNVFSSGDLLELVHKSKKKNLEVVILCDVSRSMDMYSRFFIQFLYTFKSLMSQSEIFVFGTSLHRITQDLDISNIEKSLETIVSKVQDWSGGTKIGESLHQYVSEYGLKYMSKKTLFFIMSDGWDMGDQELIAENMEQISKRCMKVIWLNPLMEHKDWKPQVQGMKAALPHIDLLLPFYNLESMKALARAL